MATRTSVATDNFNRAGPALGANWTNVNNAAAGDITITASTHIEGGSFGNPSVAKWVGAGTFTNDHYSSIVVNTGDTGTINYANGVACRISGSDATLNCYFVRKSNTCEFGKIVNGTATEFTGFPQALALSASDRLELEVEGTTIRVLKNGVAIGGQFTVTDATHTTGVPGLLMVGDASGIAIGDDWDGGSLASVTTVQTHYRWRNDDGSETTATWAAAEDTAITAGRSVNKRLRALVDTTGDLATTQFQLEYKLSSDSTYGAVQNTGAPTITSLGTMGTGTSSTSNSSYAMTTATTSLAVGQYAILVSAADNTSTTDADNSELTSVTDSASNTWSKLGEFTNGEGSAGAGITCSVWWTRATAALNTGGTITLNFGSNRTDKCCGAWAFSSTKLLVRTQAVQSNATDASNGFGSAAFSGLASAARLYFRGLAKEANSATAITNTTNFTTTAWTVRSRNNAAAVLARAEFRINTSTGETSNPTLAVSGDTAGVFVALDWQEDPITLSASANVTASGEATTAQLSPPGGKSTSDFVAGRMQDDENPADTIDITTDDYSEWEWSLIAQTAASDANVYQFRVTMAGSALSTYSVTPSWTIGSASVDPGVVFGSASVIGTPFLVLN